jgi:hypothetical protein
MAKNWGQVLTFDIRGDPGTPGSIDATKYFREFYRFCISKVNDTVSMYFHRVTLILRESTDLVSQARRNLQWTEFTE